MKRDLPLITLILLVAAALRLFGLGQYPPGPHYDEAANLLISRSITFDGANLFPITNSYQGRESLYFYLNIPFLRFIADDIFAMRLSSAFVNLLTIAASISLSRFMFKGERGHIIALIVGISMTISFHQIFMGRQVFRAVTLPMMQALGLLFLWRGLRVNNRLLLLIGGAFSAGALYTYMASRLFPMWLGIGGLALLWLDRKQWKVRLEQGGVFFGAMMLFALPVIIYAVQNPDIFFQRLTEVTGGEYQATLGESVRAHAEMFFVHGDHANLRYNVPHRPYFTLIEGVLLVIGLLTALWRLLRPGDSLARAAYLMVLLSPLMVIPSVVSTGEIPPSHMRSLGMIPLIFIAVGIGGEVVYRFTSHLVATFIKWAALVYPSPFCHSNFNARGLLQVVTHIIMKYVELIFIEPHPFRTFRSANERSPSPFPMERGEPARLGFHTMARGEVYSKNVLRPMTFVLLLMIGSVNVANIYADWVRRADLFYQTDADLAWGVDWLEDRIDEETLVYVGAYHRDHPTVLIDWQRPVTWLGSDSLFLPPDDQEGILLLAHGLDQTSAWSDLLRDDALAGIPPGPDGKPAFGAYWLNDVSNLPELTPPDEPVRSPYLILQGIYGDPIPAGEAGIVTTVWQVTQPPPYAQMRPILDVIAPSGVVLSSTDAFPLQTDRWRADETMFQQLRVNIPPGTPPGRYPLHLTWVDRITGDYVGYLADDGRYGGITAHIGVVEVIKPDQMPPPSALNITNPADVDLESGVRLLGWGDVPGSLRPGETFPLTLYLQATADSPQNVDFSGLLRGEDDTLLWDGEIAYSPIDWDADELITLYTSWTVPREQANGSYDLFLRSNDTEVRLNSVEIAGIPRQFEPPAVENVVEVGYGESLVLYGYTLEMQNGIQLDLVWQAANSVEADYTVFVHVVDEAGTTVVQHDAMPRSSTYPTSLWQAGEYVQERITFQDLPEGTYTLRVGLYIQADGTRLPVIDVTNNQYDFYEIHADGVIHR